METFGAKLKKLRIEKGLTGGELGKILNVTKMTISRWESDTRFPDKDTLVKISNFFNVSADYLLGITAIEKEVNQDNTPVTQEEAETLAEDFLDMLIKHGKIKTKEDLTPQNVFKLLDEIFNEIDNN